MSTKLPRVSVGSMATLLMEKMLLESGLPTHIQSVATEDPVGALTEGNIDLLIIQAGNVTVPEGVTVQTILPWHAVLVSPRYFYWPRGELQNPLRTFVWPEGTFAHKLNERFAQAAPEFAIQAEAYTNSYLSALEMVRRGLPYQLVIPNIYLTREDARKLPQASPESPVEDALLALCKSSDAERWASYMDPALWKRAVRH